jgi:hypothetical protein
MSYVVETPEIRLELDANKWKLNRLLHRSCCPIHWYMDLYTLHRRLVAPITDSNDNYDSENDPDRNDFDEKRKRLIEVLEAKIESIVNQQYEPILIHRRSLYHGANMMMCFFGGTVDPQSFFQYHTKAPSNSKHGGISNRPKIPMLLDMCIAIVQKHSLEASPIESSMIIERIESQTSSLKRSGLTLMWLIPNTEFWKKVQNLTLGSWDVIAELQPIEHEYPATVVVFRPKGDRLAYHPRFLLNLAYTWSLSFHCGLKLRDRYYAASLERGVSWTPYIALKKHVERTGQHVMVEYPICIRMGGSPQDREHVDDSHLLTMISECEKHVGKKFATFYWWTRDQENTMYCARLVMKVLHSIGEFKSESEHQTVHSIENLVNV